MRNYIISLASISSLGGATAWSSRSRGVVASPPPLFVLSIRGGATEYETKFEGVKCSVIEKASKKVRPSAAEPAKILYLVAFILIEVPALYSNPMRTSTKHGTQFPNAHDSNRLKRRGAK